MKNPAIIPHKKNMPLFCERCLPDPRHGGIFAEEAGPEPGPSCRIRRPKECRNNERRDRSSIQNRIFPVRVQRLPVGNHRGLIVHPAGVNLRFLIDSGQETREGIVRVVVQLVDVRRDVMPRQELLGDALRTGILPPARFAFGYRRL